MKYVTIKVHESTRLYLRVVAAVTGEQMVQVLERLCRAEMERVVGALPENGMIVIHGRKSEGKSYIIDRFTEQLGDDANSDREPDRDAGTNDDTD